MKSNSKDFQPLSDHFAEIKKVSEKISAQFALAFKQVNDISNNLQPLFEAQKESQENSASIVEVQKVLAEQIASIEDPMARLAKLVPPSLEFSEFRNQINEFRTQTDKLISSAQTDISRSLKRLPTKLQKALTSLAKQGWFIDVQMPLPMLWNFQEAIQDGNVEKVEKFLVNYFEAQLDTIEVYLVAKFPHRSTIISAACKAHRNKDYVLSVPVFMAQSDGICYEVIKHHFFLKRDSKPQTAIYVEAIAAETLQAALLSPLTQSLPIAASARERGEDFDQLNRHMVLHGESLDYGTCINSLKTLSLLNYVAHVLKSDNP